METPGPWTAQDFRDLLAQKGTFLITPSTLKYPGGAGAEPPPAATVQPSQDLRAFALGRVILDEAELLTLATDPDRRRQGLARACLAAFEEEARQRAATTAFLEVAATNAAARALYESAGWHRTGLRKDYYKSPQGRIDAIVMSKPLSAD
jgi:ribosomal-protein-alanine N-acetyltransferase